MLLSSDIVATTRTTHTLTSIIHLNDSERYTNVVYHQGWQKPQKSKKYVKVFWVIGFLVGF